ncbi:MAG: SRPBCC domain-containing protein [Nitrospirales bacterium]|nr:SRPBCC domain-containing protein [Planctomycetota bacterium]MEB2337474.1 SRPBCC domain-containing protein [Nitrospirales bacterium]QOJ35416.1 MAG: SRPBCC domain-containing protein [Nitrospira sp.]
MKELLTEIHINASRGTIWNVLADFSSYPEWNPFIRSISGNPKPGETLKAKIQPTGGRGMTFRPRVLVSKAGEELRWLGHLIIPGLFDGEHAFQIERLGDHQSRFIQRERFRGLLVPLLWRSIEPVTRRGFEEMNAALKRRAEGLQDQYMMRTSI